MPLNRAVLRATLAAAGAAGVAEAADGAQVRRRVDIRFADTFASLPPHAPLRSLFFSFPMPRPSRSPPRATPLLSCPCPQAYELFRTCGGSATFPLVLMDLSMPVCDGWTAASYIRALERAMGWPPCAIVACTSEDISPGSPALARCWDVGMDAAVVRRRAALP